MKNKEFWEAMNELYDPEIEAIADQMMEEDRQRAREILEPYGEATFTGCMIPLQIKLITNTGKYCYARNSRVGGDVKMWIFNEYCDLSKGWPNETARGRNQADAWHYEDIAKEMKIMLDCLSTNEVLLKNYICRNCGVPIILDTECIHVDPDDAVINIGNKEWIDT